MPLPLHPVTHLVMLPQMLFFLMFARFSRRVFGKGVRGQAGVMMRRNTVIMATARTFLLLIVDEMSYACVSFNVHRLLRNIRATDATTTANSKPHDIL